MSRFVKSYKRALLRPALLRPSAWLAGRLDKAAEGSGRTLARRTARRSFLSRLGTVLVGAAAFPLLPVARGAQTSTGTADTGNPADPGDPQSCDYWRYCGISGFLCSCCGGSQSSCPPGTEVSPITWIGTCQNPADGKEYVISYNDCCGKSGCGRCQCHRDEGARPLYRPALANEYNWCMGTKSQAYNCSTAYVIGTSLE